ncbi:hypothetical protein ACSMXN_14680 [Jatrophihabitans sp. DSM 45814]
MVELCATDMPADPRLLDTWSSQRKMWEFGHPLTIRRLAYVTLGCKDLDEATSVYIKRMQAIPVHEGIDDEERCRFQVLQLGDCLLRLAQPLDDDSPLGKHVTQWGNCIYGITLRVRDVDSAEAWLQKKNVRTERLRPGLLAANPEDCFGAPYFFTDESVPGDPFEV